MDGFRLSSNEQLPRFIMDEGKRYSINPGARNMLKILRMLSDEDVAPTHRAVLLLKWFYEDEVPKNAQQCFEHFLMAGQAEQDDTDTTEPDFDYEFDAKEIYASFLQLYGIDMLAGEDMHWWRFRALLSGCFLVPCALLEKVKLRHIDPSECKNPAKAERAIERVRIPTHESEAERRMSELINERLKAGQPIDDLMSRG